jgi:ribosome-binding protein aMBF1 (putative translation factor)
MKSDSKSRMLKSNQHIGRAIMMARLRKNLSRNELADKLGIGTKHLQFIENGTKDVSEEVLKKLIFQLSIDIKELEYIR